MLLVFAVTTAILAENQASRVAPVGAPLSFPNARLLALGASLVGHVALGALAYAHAAGAPARVPGLALPYTTPTSVEIVIAPSTVPPPAAVEGPKSTDERPAPHAASTPRSVVAPAIVVSTAQPATGASVAAAVPAVPFENTAPRFIMQAPVVTAAARTGTATPAQGTTTQGAVNPVAAQLPFAEGQVDSPAKLQAGSPPTYTAAAEAAGVEVELPLELVIDREGAVQSARTLQHVGYGLDEAAVAAVQHYRFSPARRAGNAVPVRMRWVLRFQLR